MSDYKRYIDFLKVIADPTRLDILELLKDSEKRALKIKNSLGRSQSTISKHLNILVDNKLIEFEKRENVKYYKIRYIDIFNLIDRIKYTAYDITKDKLKDIRDADIIDTLL